MLFIWSRTCSVTEPPSGGVLALRAMILSFLPIQRRQDGFFLWRFGRRVFETLRFLRVGFRFLTFLGNRHRARDYGNFLFQCFKLHAALGTLDFRGPYFLIADFTLLCFCHCRSPSE